MTACVMLTHLTGGGQPVVCGRDLAHPDRWPAGHPMCPAHCDRMERWAHRRHVVLSEQAFARRVESEMAAHAAAEAHRAANSVVYFVQRADGLIKIGFSSQFRERLATLSRHFGPLETLWTVKGGRDLERRHHEQFAAERVAGSEWFQPSQRLLAYIDRVIEANDDQAVAS